MAIFRHIDGDATPVNFPEPAVALPIVAKRVEIGVRRYADFFAGRADLPIAAFADPGRTYRRVHRPSVGRWFLGYTLPVDFVESAIAFPAPVDVCARIGRNIRRTA